jgi:hypothetical protein
LYYLFNDGFISNDQGNRTIPFYFSFSDNERLIGDAAKKQVDMNFEKTYVGDCHGFEIPDEPISNISKWDPRRRKRGDSTTPADTNLTGRCLVRLLSSYGNETDEHR